MSLWQFMACVEGYADAHTPDDKKARTLSDAQIERLDTLMKKASDGDGY